MHPTATPPWQSLTPVLTSADGRPRATITMTRRNPNIQRYIDADELAERLHVTRGRARRIARLHCGSPLYMGGGRQGRAAYYDRAAAEALIAARDTGGTRPPAGYCTWAEALNTCHIGTPRLRDLIHRGRVRCAAGRTHRGWPRTYPCIADLCAALHLPETTFSKTTI